MKYNKILYCLILLISGNISAQEYTKPLELPAFIIEGVEQHNIRSSIKQAPNKTSILTTSELDSLNTFEKQQPTLIPPSELPAHYIDKKYMAGYINASYGLFNTPEIDAHYRFWADRFDIFASAGGNKTDGDALNSNNNKLFLDIRTNYIADEKFFIFGGSNTRTNLFLNTQNFNFYGYGTNNTNQNEIYPQKDYYDRNITQAKFEVKSDGRYENILFAVGGTANYIATNNNEARHITPNNISNYYARGYLTVKNYWNNFLLAGNADINFESYDATMINFYQFDASASYFDNNFSILLRGGLQFTNNSQSINRNALLLSANIEYRINKLFTLKTNIFSGIEKTEYEHLITLNPYITRATIDHRHDLPNINGSIWYHPNENLMLSAGANWRYSNRNINFISDTLAEFSVLYIDGIVFDIYGEMFWNISKNDRIISKIALNMNDLKENNHLTYIPLFQFTNTYHRHIIDKLKGYVTLELTGSRKLYAEQNDILDPYVLLNLGLDYTINPFNFYIKINNLFNSNYVIWERYRERGFYGAIGIIFMF
ncbi:MAG: hypothetical protein FWG85_06190 [Bacteroidetes bacterium]|nr:hypothetical protein [Bacteroidota bacterium]